MSMLTTRDHKHSEASAKANSVSAALLVRVALSQALASEAIKSRRQKKLNQLCRPTPLRKWTGVSEKMREIREVRPDN